MKSDVKSRDEIYRTVAKSLYLLAGIVILLWFLYEIITVLLIFTLALILAIVLNAPTTWLESRKLLLIRDGEIQWDNMRKSHISKKDLELALRSNGKITDASDAKEARFERSGDISVIPHDRKEPRVFEVSVQEGVQTIRIEVD